MSLVLRLSKWNKLESLHHRVMVSSSGQREKLLLTTRQVITQPLFVHLMVESEGDKQMKLFPVSPQAPPRGKDPQRRAPKPTETGGWTA